MKFLTPERLKKRNIDGQKILRLVERAYEFSPGTLVKRSNRAQFVHARHVVGFLLLKYGCTTIEAGELLARDHSTVCHSQKVVERLLPTDDSLRSFVESLEHSIETSFETFSKPPARVFSKLKPLHKRASVGVLPDIANGTVHGTEDLDELIRTGKGDIPRLAIGDLHKRPN